MAFFTALPVAVTFKSDKLVVSNFFRQKRNENDPKLIFVVQSLSVKYYCKAILLSLGVKVNYIGNKPTLDSPHVFVVSFLKRDKYLSY